MPPPFTSRAAALLLVAAPLLRAQAAPGPESFPLAAMLERGRDLLEREDPLGAWEAFLDVQAHVHDRPETLLGLGRAHLLLERSATARAYAAAVLRADPASADAMALEVRGLIRGRGFEAALARAQEFLGAHPAPGGELLAAHASALFRLQRIDAAAQAYREVLANEPLHPEAHLRLGSGLLPPGHVEVGAGLRAAVAQARRGDLVAAAAALLAALQREPGHPVAHRLLGEVLWLQRARAGMASHDPAFLLLRASLPAPRAEPSLAADFVPGYPDLDAERRAVVDRALSLFASRIPRLLAIGGRHDLLLELERTTDAPQRSALRGLRTFDGRVWDDVRGVGGLRAATGIEALDEAALSGFDTLVHELAHQVHYFALPQRDQARIRELYGRARARERFLDHYAATNEAEYFGQGVEAFASHGKRPGGEVTHGHTRWELLRVDPELHEFIAGIVDVDPLRDPAVRERVLAAAVGVALRCGKGEDAVAAAELLDGGPLRERLLAEALRMREVWREY